MTDHLDHDITTDIDDDITTDRDATRDGSGVISLRAGGLLSPTRRRRPDEGFSFVEVVITVVLIGVVVLPILSAVRTSVRAASVSRAAAEVETVLINAADRINRADRTKFKCDLSSPAKQAAIVQGGEWTADDITLDYQYWDGTQFLPGACPGDGYKNGLVQLVRITVTDPEGSISRKLEVVKSDI